MLSSFVIANSVSTSHKNTEASVDQNT